MDKSIGWELYRTFLSVLKEGSLSAAARALGITQPTAGRHIAALERALGIALFTRAPDGLKPTDNALGLRIYAETMESTAASFKRAASGQGAGVRGVVRVSASEVMGVEILPPVIAQLQEVHPALKVELVLSNRVQDLLRREADIAVRMVRPEQTQLLARRVANIQVGLYARNDYLALRGTPKRLEDLADHTLIGYDQGDAFVRKASLAFPFFNQAVFSIRSDSDLAQLSFIRNGAGIGGCQVGIAVRDATLIRLFRKEFTMELEVWVTMHEDLRNSPRCRVMFDALVAALDN